MMASGQTTSNAGDGLTNHHHGDLEVVGVETSEGITVIEYMTIGTKDMVIWTITGGI